MELKNARTATHGPYGALADFGAVLLRRWKSIVAVAVIASLAGAAIALLMPRTFTSIAYLGPLDEANGKSTGAIMRSPPIVDPVLAKFRDFRAGHSLDERRADLAASLNWQLLRGSPLTSGLYTLELQDTDAKRAQAILNEVLDRWLEASKPRPDTAVRLQKMLEASEAQSADLSQAIDELKKRPDAMFADSRGGYLPPNIVDMIKLRTETAARILELTAGLRAGSRDLIFSPPSLPDQPDGRGTTRFALGSMLAAVGALVLRYLCLWIGPRLSLKQRP
ncbi:hypothetical protein ACFFWD_22770 [Bradyrhizobium erythrophlei]|uniref:hypothetical protein n=1 Tax=Bradyrhizobium erythrophlei TaxID=1437360 RepID=UPI0035ED78FC